jgi:hypothetical protein
MRMQVHWRYVVGAGFAAALLAAPVAVGVGEGQPVEGGARNPTPNPAQEYTRETEIIAQTNTYGTRQSNKSNNGGGAIYGCRSGAGGSPRGNEPCVRANNLSDGRAFEFRTGGTEVGRIESSNANAAPFTTNATGVAQGLNADRLDGRDGQQIQDEAVAAARAQSKFAAVTPTGTLAAGRDAASATREGVGVYAVTFASDVNACAYSATVIGGEGAQGFAAVEPVNARTLRVRTRAATDGGGGGVNDLADRQFHLVATC